MFYVIEREKGNKSCKNTLDREDNCLSVSPASQRDGHGGQGDIGRCEQVFSNAHTLSFKISGVSQARTGPGEEGRESRPHMLPAEESFCRRGRRTKNHTHLLLPPVWLTSRALPSCEASMVVVLAAGLSTWPLQLGKKGGMRGGQ